ncbi:uncharacterized protein LTR77_001203 [Saxophila tyrrhenica]|uniref:Uncharacterized protein n=1 Tax=Saxophila tyrrhenica TaxID=1690608 RepID=A0AAV9PJG6_9PEZI|nr:hypothetical protein LTR77_001203 [Saxophila tyrrhenica]
MDHMQYLVVRSHNPEDQDFKHPLENSDDREYDHMSGHALMATCPPYSHVRKTPNEPYPYKMPELESADLSKLLDLSARLPLGAEGEITPIMAWTQIIRDPRTPGLTKEDLERVRDDLSTKVRCYGFGAVLEEFELNDAMNSVIAEKATLAFDLEFGPQQLAVMAS